MICQYHLFIFMKNISNRLIMSIPAQKVTRIIGLFLVGFQLIPMVVKSQLSANEMQVHFINTGQADAALLEFPCGAILIDAGAQDAASSQYLIQYLHNFFTRRADLNNTLDLVVISHDHIDHDFALNNVAQTFHIKNYIDNGHTVGSGEPYQSQMEYFAHMHGINYENFCYEHVTAGGNKNGLTDGIVSPIQCAMASPQITILSGRFESPKPGWTKEDFANENNHSLVVRVQFGKASFLFTGDLETAGDQTLVNYYSGTSALDADIWKVSHHGAVNGTSKSWLKAVTPLYAFINCGQWNFGQGPPVETFSTYAYGHPRAVTLNLLQQSISGTRQQPVTIKAATGQYKFINYRVSKNVYATAWDGNITIKATDQGQYQVMPHDQ